MTTQISLDLLLTGLLAGVRLVTLLGASPLFGHLAVPPRLRVAIALGISLGLMPPAVPGLAELPAMSLGAAVIREALIGLALGFVVRVIFASFTLLGELVAIQGGLGAARVLDPANGAPTVALGRAFQTFALFVFLSIGGHQELIRAAAHSFAILPVAGVGPGVQYAVVAQTGGAIYDAAGRLALPVTAAMLVTNAGVGLVGRAIPQLNLMSVQLPAQVAFLLVLLSFGAQPLIEGMARLLTDWTHAAPELALGG